MTFVTKIANLAFLTQEKTPNSIKKQTRSTSLKTALSPLISFLLRTSIFVFPLRFFAHYIHTLLIYITHSIKKKMSIFAAQ